MHTISSSITLKIEICIGTGVFCVATRWNMDMGKHNNYTSINGDDIL